MTKEEAIKVLSNMDITLYLQDKHYEALELAIEALKRDDPEVEFQTCLENSRLCGYSFKELLLFADMCRRINITTEEMHNFCLSVENAFKYVLSKIEESITRGMLS